MINEFDIQDWEMLTEPLELQQLKEKDLFSVGGASQIFEYCHDLGDRIMSVFHTPKDEVPITITFPYSTLVYKWQKLV